MNLSEGHFSHFIYAVPCRARKVIPIPVPILKSTSEEFLPQSLSHRGKNPKFGAPNGAISAGILVLQRILVSLIGFQSNGDASSNVSYISCPLVPSPFFISNLLQLQSFQSQTQWTL